MDKKERFQSLKPSQALLLTMLFASLFMGACSPLAPSVSKFSNSTTKSPTSGDSTDTSSTTKSNLVSSKVATPLVVSSSEYQNIKNSEKKPHEELTKTDVENLATNSNASFYANDNSVVGFETDLMKKSVKVYLVVSSMSRSDREDLQSKIQISVAIDRTDRLSVTVANADKAIKENLMAHLTAAAIEFEDIALASGE